MIATVERKVLLYSTRNTPGEMDKQKLERVMSAVEEFAAGAMSVEKTDERTYVVKGYNVDPSLPYCECNDHDYNEEYCKHIVAATLYDLWDGDESAVSDGGNTLVSPDYGALPSTLTSIETWLLWQYRGEGKHRALVPLAPETGGVADDISDCTSFERAKELDSNPESVTHGVAFLCNEADPFDVRTFQNAYNADADELRELTSAGEDAIKSPLTYCEVAPNGRDITVVEVTDDAPVEPNPVPLTGKSIDSTGVEQITDTDHD